MDIENIHKILFCVKIDVGHIAKRFICRKLKCILYCKFKMEYSRSKFNLCFEFTIKKEAILYEIQEETESGCSLSGSSSCYLDVCNDSDVFRRASDPLGIQLY